MYLNILAEMTRMQLNAGKMAKSMRMPTELLERKLRKQKDFTIKDIFKMQKIFNKSYCTFEYLLQDFSNKYNSGV